MAAAVGAVRGRPATPGLRDRLILHYAPLVKYVAGRVGSGLPGHVEQADLVSYGTFGLIDAITRYEPTREVKFESYAMARIRGAIIDELRNTDWIPRSVRIKARQFERTVAELEARLHRTPTDDEVADAMDMDVEEIRKFLGQLSLVNVVALDELLTDDDGGSPRLGDTLQDTSALDPQAMAENGEARQLLARAVEQLPEREKIVVSPLLLRGPHPRRHRPGARRDREPHLPDAHQGRAPPAHQARRHRLTDSPQAAATAGDRSARCAAVELPAMSRPRLRARDASTPVRSTARASGQDAVAARSERASGAGGPTATPAGRDRLRRAHMSRQPRPAWSRPAVTAPTARSPAPASGQAAPDPRPGGRTGHEHRDEMGLREQPEATPPTRRTRRTRTQARVSF